MRWIAAGLLAIASPAMASDYVVIELHADVKASADTTWAKIGDYCAIEKWAGIACKLTSGTGGVGSIRTLNNGAAVEPMVAHASHSYTYSQIVGGSKGLDYHGTLAVDPVGRNASRITYTLLYDQSLVAAEKRETMHTGMAARFQTFMDKMKGMAEAK
jgi:hypothetical protein